jgi:hypothetical protein
VIISLNSINRLICLMEKCGVLFEVQTEYLSIFLDELRLQWVNKRQ